MRASRALPGLLLGLATALAVAPAPGCVGALRGSPTARAAAFEAEGNFLRHLRIRCAPSHTQSFERLLRRCVEVADDNGLADGASWLVYREPPGRYWLLFTAWADEGLGTTPTLAGFVSGLARQEGGSDLAARLDDIEHETEWELLCQKRKSWSFGGEVDPRSHPAARMMVRRVRPGREAEFEAALDARTAFLREAGYPLAVEGFVIREGLPGHALQVVFPVDWPTFHASTSFHAFSRGLPAGPAEEYAARKAALMVTMASAEYLDGTYAPELSR